MTRTIALILAIGLLVATLATLAHAHSFYDPECCHDQDCSQVASPDVIHVVPSGFYVTVTGETIDRKDPRVRLSPDGNWHWCGYKPGQYAWSPSGHTYCIYVPGGGV